MIIFSKQYTNLSLLSQSPVHNPWSHNGLHKMQPWQFLELINCDDPETTPTEVAKLWHHKSVIGQLAKMVLEQHYDIKVKTPTQHITYTTLISSCPIYGQDIVKSNHTQLVFTTWRGMPKMKNCNLIITKCTLKWKTSSSLAIDFTS